MTDIFKGNISAQSVIRNAVARSNKALNKYNESMHMNTEELSGEPNDLTGFDCGMERELINNHE